MTALQPPLFAAAPRVKPEQGGMFDKGAGKV